MQAPVSAHNDAERRETKRCVKHARRRERELNETVDLVFDNFFGLAF